MKHFSLFIALIFISPAISFADKVADTLRTIGNVYLVETAKSVAVPDTLMAQGRKYILIKRPDLNISSDSNKIVYLASPIGMDSSASLIVKGQLYVASEEFAMADLMRSNGYIYVVVGVLLLIFVGLIAYLLVLDNRLKKLEK